MPTDAFCIKNMKRGHTTPSDWVFSNMRRNGLSPSPIVSVALDVRHEGTLVYRFASSESPEEPRDMPITINATQDGFTIPAHTPDYTGPCRGQIKVVHADTTQFTMEGDILFATDDYTEAAA